MTSDRASRRELLWRLTPKDSVHWICVSEWLITFTRVCFKYLNFLYDKVFFSGLES